MVGHLNVEMYWAADWIVDRSDIDEADGWSACKLRAHAAEVVVKDLRELKVKAHALANARRVWRRRGRR